jgi:hypothetical protein
VLILLRLTYITCIVIQIYPKSNSLQIYSLDSGGAETLENFLEIPGFPETPDLARSVRTLRVYIPFSPRLLHLLPLTTLTSLPFTPVASPLFLTLPLGDFHLHPSKSSVSEGLRAPRCGDRRSTSVSKD